MRHEIKGRRCLDHSTPVHLCEWQTPEQLFARANIGGLNREQFFCSREAKRMREAWILGRIGMLLPVLRVRLSPDDAPDGFFEIANFGTFPVEVTELLQKGRRRGVEDYSSLEVVHQNHDELTAAIDGNAAWLGELINKKLDREHNYPPKTVLLIYHNTSLYNFDAERVCSELESASRVRGKNIVGSLILFDGRVYGQSILERLLL